MALKLIAGSSHPVLAKKISKFLKTPLTPVIIKKFADGEIYLRVSEKVRGDDVYVIQSLTSPANENIMELLILVDALRRASVGRINLLIPYLAYSRQDRKAQSRESISAKLLADIITASGADRVITVDLHANQLQGFYNIPFDHFVGYPMFAEYLKEKNIKNMVIVAPDMGATKRADKMADLLDVPLAIMHKVRYAHNMADVTHMIGDVKNKTAVIIDDMIDTGGSIVAATSALENAGAKKIIVCATHALLSGNAIERLEKANISQVLLLDTVPITDSLKSKKFKVISLAPLFAKIIKRIHRNKSLGELFTWENKATKL